MNKTPIYIALGIAASPAFAQGVDKSAANYKEGPFSDYTAYIDKLVESTAQGQLPENVDMKELYRMMGFDSIKTYSQSSTPDGSEWVNKIHLNNGGNHEGVFKLLSSSKHKGLVVPNIAPVGTDLAAQISMNLASLEPIILNAVKLSGEDAEEVKQGVNEVIPPLEMNTSDLLKKLDLRLNFVLDLDDAQKIPTPIGEFDKPHLTIRIDGISWLWEKVGAMAIGGSGLPFSKTDEGAISTYSLPAEMAAQFMGYSPTIKVDTAGDYIWISSTPEFLNKCSSGQNTLAESPAFKAVMKDMPTDGFSFGYASKEFYNFFGSTLDNLEKQGMLENIDETTKSQLKTARNQASKLTNGSVQIMTTDANGILWAERGAQTIEQQMLEAMKSLEASSAKKEEAEAPSAE